MTSLLAEDQPPPSLPPKATGWEEELKGYLNLEWSATNPCHFWRENARNFPTLAALARDVFSIPATGASVERLFSTACDICHYRRGSLNESMIQDLMMLCCLSRFDIRDEETDDSIQPESILNQDERTEIDEQREAGLPDYTPEPISDGEDGEDSVDDEADNVNSDNMDTATEEAEPDDSIHH
ncbi:hypothetical protein N7465_012012 [Penicillium sp. CMV-2018d]|nr:hypothetical protein N7465_012012 [Penicillium sp. CMV-2018d]